MSEAVMASQRSRPGTLGYAMWVYSRRFAGRRGNGSTDLPGLVALARIDRRTKNLTRSTGQAGRFTRGIRVPELRTNLDGRHALVIARGYRHREDLNTLRAYIREFKPVLVAVDGGADALLEAGYRPQLVVGDMDSVSDRALTCGAEIVVHAYADGAAPGLERVQSLGIESALCPAKGTSEDVALLLSDELGARLIVAVGMRTTLVEFLDKGRAGMASAFLTRMRVGDKIVEPKGVSRLYQSRISTAWLVLLIVAAAVTIVAALYISPANQVITRFAELQLSAF